MSINVAVIVAGCGYQDGTDVYECAYLVKALEERGAIVHFFSIDDPRPVFDHRAAKYDGTTRIPIVEATRLSVLKDVKNINELNPDEFDGLFFPGGYGLLVNYSNLSRMPNQAFFIHPGLVKIIKTFHAQNKMIGTVCGASILVGFVLKDHRATVSLGKPGLILEIGKFLGLNIVNAFSSEFCMDKENNLFSCPAFLCTRKTYKVALGIERMVNAAFDHREAKLNKKHTEEHQFDGCVLVNSN